MTWTVDDFDIGQSIGKGGFATVFRAINRKTKEHVAIKRSYRPTPTDPFFEARIVSEIRIHSQLKHPNVVPMLGCFQDGDYVYCVLEVCQGGDLHKYLRRNGPLSEELAVRVVKQLISALEYIHDQNVVHRDLKLSNILLTGDIRDRNASVKVADFGLAIRKEHPDEEHFTLCGTPNYIAPEVASCEAHGYPADLWSVGCLFYSLVVGAPPFEGEDKETTLARVRSGLYDEPESGVMSELGRDFVRCLLEMNPVKRANIRELLVHPLFCSGMRGSLTPLSRPFSSMEGRFSESSAQQVSVGRRSNPTRAAWDEIGSTDTTAAHHSIAPVPVRAGGASVSREAAPVCVTLLSDVLVEEDDEFSLSEKLQFRSHTASPSHQHSPHHSNTHGAHPRRAHALQELETKPVRDARQPPDNSSNLNEQYLRKQSELQQEIYMLQQQCQRKVHELVEPNASQTTAATALVSYQHTTQHTTQHSQRTEVSVTRTTLATQAPISPEVNRGHVSRAHTPVSNNAPYPAQHGASVSAAPVTARRRTQSPPPPQTRSEALRPPTLSTSEPTQTVRASKMSPQVPVAEPPTSSQAAVQRPDRVIYAHEPARNAPPTPGARASLSGASGVSTSFLHGLTFDYSRTESSWAHSSRSWLDSISEIRSSLSANSAGDVRSPASVRNLSVAAPSSPVPTGSRPAHITHYAHSGVNAEVGAGVTAGSRVSTSVIEGAVYKEWSKQHAYERFVSGMRGTSSPHSVGTSLSDPAAAPVDAPLTACAVLESAQRDMCSLKPFCMSSNSGREAVLLSTDRHLLYYTVVSRDLPDGTAVKQYVRMLLTPEMPECVLYGSADELMLREVGEICAAAASGRTNSAKSQIIEDLNASYTDDGRAAAQSRATAVDGLKYHHSYTAAHMSVFDPHNTKVLTIDAETEHAVPAIILRMLRSMHKMLVSAKCRMPRQTMYFSTPIPETSHVRASNTRSSTSLSHASFAAPVKNVTCKCMVMSNDPFPDFYMHWDDGVKLLYELQTGRVRIQKPQVGSGQNASKALAWSGVLSLRGADGGVDKCGILPEFAPYALAAQKVLTKCLSESRTSSNGVPKVCSLD